ncbi:MAG TPA: ribosome recycling factor [Patescibacteria group bacterium]
MNDIIKKHQAGYQDLISHLREDLKSLRTGRANPAMIENIVVEAYGVKTSLNQLASISLADAKTLVVQPWDKNILKDIEKAIVQANIGINPVNEGSLLRLSLPQLTEENRKELINILHQKGEKTKIAIKVLRDKVKEEIVKAEKNKEITEDDRFDYLKELDEFTRDYNDQVKAVMDDKEKEIMTI